MKSLCLSLLLIAVIFAGGCASNYHTINPGRTHFPAPAEKEYGLSFAYKYDLLRAKGNKKYAKKEDKKGVRVVAVKITNNTGSTLIFPDDFDIMSGDSPVYLLEPEAVHRQLKQGVPIYLLYLLFTPMNLYTYDDTGVTSSTPVGLLLGPGLTALNIGIAASANNKFKQELLDYDIYNMEIKDGETITGLIGITDNGYAPLSLELK